MKRFFVSLNYVGAGALVLGLVMRMFLPGWYAVVYMFGAVLFAVTQFLLRPRYNGVAIRRLVAQQQLAGVFLVCAGVLMFTHYSNEWILVLLCGTLLELYSAFRLSHEIDKLENNKK